MKIAVAGATGLIGQMLTEHLLAHEHSVVVLTRNPRREATLPHPGLRIVWWDGRNPGSWHQSIVESDAVINLAGASLASGRWTKTRKQTLISSRVDPTKAIVAAMKGGTPRPQVLINASAVGYYGPVEEGEVTEDHIAGVDFAGRLCTQWEESALEAEPIGIRVVLVRSGIVLDPRGGALRRMLLPFKMFMGGPLGSGNQWLPWIHREDEVRAIRFVVEHSSVSGPVNLVAPESTRMRQFSTTLGEVLHRPSGLRVPAFTLRTILGEMADVVLTGQRVIPQKLQLAGFSFRFPTLKSALDDLLKNERRNTSG